MNDADAKRIAYDYGLDLGAPGYAYADGVFGCSDIRTRRRGWGIKRWQLSNAERIIIPNVAVLIGSVFFVESFAKPGGHTTGFAAYESGMGGKWIQLLKEVTPRTRRIAVIYNPETSPFERFLPSMRVSVDALGVEVTVARVHDGDSAGWRCGSRFPP